MAVRNQFSGTGLGTGVVEAVSELWLSLLDQGQER